MDIRDGKGLKPEDVSLLDFERKNGEANIHRLHSDEQATSSILPRATELSFLKKSAASWEGEPCA